jgi:hypothetical protein
MGIGFHFLFRGSSRRSIKPMQFQNASLILVLENFTRGVAHPINRDQREKEAACKDKIS